MSPDRIDLHTLSGVYVADALDDGERAKFEAHLEECSTCRDEVRELREVAAHLSYDVSMEAPASLRASVLSSISQVRPLPPVADSATEVSVAATSETVDELDARRRRKSASFVKVLGVAAAVLALASVTLGGLNLSLRNQLNQSAASSDSLHGLLAASDVQVSQAEVTTGGHATIVSSSSMNDAVFVGADLATLPANKTYELWLIGPSGTPQSAGTFAASGSGPAVVNVDGNVQPQTVMALTVEPAGGSSAPTSPPIMKTVLS